MAGTLTLPPYWFYGYDIPAGNVRIIVNGRKRPVVDAGNVAYGTTPDWYATVEREELGHLSTPQVQFHLLNDDGDLIATRTVRCDKNGSPVAVDWFLQVDEHGNWDSDSVRITKDNFATINMQSIISGVYAASRVSRHSMIRKHLQEIGLSPEQIDSTILHLFEN